MFLDSLQIQSPDSSRLSSYAFYYNNLTELPARFSYSQDHWGYFNGKSNTDFALKSEVPSDYQNLFSTLILTTANRDPDYTYSRKGMLQKIVFPTRGYTTIDYESNINSAGSNTGGCRVLRTNTYESASSSPEVKKYLYSMVQSSINYKYYDSYRSQNFDGTCQNVGSCTIGVLSSNSYYNLSLNGLFHVLYGKVEILSGENAENGKEVHLFNSDIDTPGTALNGRPIYPLVKSNTGWKAGLLSTNYKTNSSLTEVWRRYPSYNFAETHNCKSISCLAVEKSYEPTCILFGSSSAPPLEPYNVVPYTLSSVWYYINQEQITNYQSNGNVISTVNYFYDDSIHALLTREQTTDSKGNQILKRTYYPQDYNTSSYNLGTLISNHIVNVPVDTRKYINNALDEGQQTVYNIYGQPTDIYMAETNGADVSLNLTSPYTFTHKATYGYDSYNKMNQVTNDYNSSATYLWGYNKAYPVAKIENATLTEVQTALGGSIPDLGTGGLSVSQISSLRNGLPNALVTANTYTPLIGITSQTDPNGLTTYFEYDSFGRLKLVKDKDGKILKVNNYHFSTSN